MAGHWMVIETASNQEFVFASNKQAVNVGASELIFRVGEEWVPEAVDRVDKAGVAVETIVLASGKALLIVDTEERGQSIIRDITQRALREAPGLQVWGVVDPKPITSDAERGEALERAHRLHAICRASRPSSLMRAPTLPFVKPCQYSGFPATTIGREGSDWHPRGATVDAAWRQAREGRHRMARVLKAERAVLSADRLDVGVEGAGWIAVVHADGNGVGRLFSNLHKVYSGLEYTSWLSDFSGALDGVARQALQDAIASQSDRVNWILPIVIGGDDVTAIMDGRVAFDVTVEFLRRFEQLSADNTVTREVAEAVRAKVASGEPHPVGLTASAGIAYVKPHHPFSDAYELAEQLCGAVKKADRLHSALDFHVLYDSVGRDLEQLRVPVKDRDRGPRPDPGEQVSLLRLWSGPIVVSGDGEGPGGQRAHHVARLRAAMDSQQKLGSGAVHQLRDALLTGGAAIDRAANQVIAWAENPDQAKAYLDTHLQVREPGPPRPGEVRFSRVLDAMNLLDMRRGTVEGGRRQPAEVAR